MYILTVYISWRVASAEGNKDWVEILNMQSIVYTSHNPFGHMNI